MPPFRRKLWPLVRAWRSLRDRESLCVCEYRGFQLWYPARSEIGAAVADGVAWDPMLPRVAADLVGPAEGFVVDVGANVGASLLQLKLGAPNSRFLCLEPSRRFVRALRRTVRANGWTDVRVERVAAGAARGRTALFVNPTTASVVAAAYGERTPLGAEEVDVVTLDDLAGDAPRLDLLKIDTDGFELDVLEGAEGVLERLRPALFFEFDPELLRWGGREPEDLLALLSRLGYASFEVFAPGGRGLGTVSDTSELRALARQAPHVNVLALARTRAR